MAKEQFFHSQTPALFKKLEELTRRSGVSRGQAFEDWLTAMVCALAAETKEAEYLVMVERHKRGKQGERGVDLMKQMFWELVGAMEDNDGDILGDLFQGSVTYGEAGQYFSPECLARLMAQMCVDPAARPEGDRPLLINDPCCGTGRMLVEASNVNPYAQLVGQDIDARCAKITAINLGLRDRYGWVICGNSLSGETQFAYRIGSFYHEAAQGRRYGVIRDVPPERTPVPVIAKHKRAQAGELFVEHIEQAEVEVLATEARSRIVEVPQWLARLERSLARRGSVAPTAAEASAPPHMQETLAASDRVAEPVVLIAEPPPAPDVPARVEQRTLFDA